MLPCQMGIIPTQHRMNSRSGREDLESSAVALPWALSRWAEKCLFADPGKSGLEYTFDNDLFVEHGRGSDP